MITYSIISLVVAGVLRPAFKVFLWLTMLMFLRELYPLVGKNHEKYQVFIQYKRHENIYKMLPRVNETDTWNDASKRHNVGPTCASKDESTVVCAQQ